MSAFYVTRVREGKILFGVSISHERSGSNREIAQGVYEISPKTLKILSPMSKAISGAAIDVKAPLTTEGMRRDVLLRALQKRIYFEKTVAVSMAPNNAKHCTMALPSWFVREHGDKVRQSVLLRSGSSTEPWRVQLSIIIHTPFPRSEVKLSSGWRAFAAANDLVVSDSLIFCLRAMSEFDVYIFRETGSPIQPSAIQAPRKRSRDFKLSNEKANKSVGCKRRNLVAERSAGGVISKVLEKDKARAGSRVIKGIQEWQGTNFFEKILTAGAVSKAFQLTLPTGFMQQYRDKIRKHVVLRSLADRKVWTVKVYVAYPAKRPQFIFDGGAWKAFIVSNGLVIGDRLTFTLVAMSTFEVLILRSRGNPNAVRPSVQGPVIRSKESAFSPTCQPATESRELQHVDLTSRSKVKMERESSFKLLAETEDSEDSIAYSASDSSPRKLSKDLKISIARVNKSVRRRCLVVEGSAGRVISEILEEAKGRAGSRVNKGMQDWQGKKFFEKTLTACAVSKAFQLTLPTRFMHQNADKIREHVVLQSVADGEMWTLKINIHFPGGRPQFILDCGNWKAFVVSNGLVEGDGLKFTLVAMSKFEVLILRSNGSQKAVRPSAQRPVIMSKESTAFSPTCQPATKSLGPRHLDLSGKSSVKMEKQLSSELFAEEDAEDSNAYSASDSSTRPSDMDCHIFERWYEGIE